MATRSLSDRFLDLFRPKPLVIPPGVTERPELSPADYQSRREQYPILPLTGWDAVRIQQMLESHDSGTFTESELFYHALRKEGLIASALDMRRAAVQELSWTLQCPKGAPDEVHHLTEMLARDWQSVLPDDVRGEVIERFLLFGFMVCRVQWAWSNGQRQPRLIPYTHSSLSWRQDLWCYQGQSERGIEYISSDGREWVIFSLGGTRPWLRGLIRPLAFVYFGLIVGDDAWLAFNDKFSQPRIKRVVPRIPRESTEVQRMYAKESQMRGGDVVLCPQDPETGRGYDIEYVQVAAEGYKTMADQLERFDERAAIILLGHNLLQRVKGGSLAAMRGALGLLRTKAVADAKVLMSGFEPISKVWARANFGQDPDDFPELGGRLVESVTWSLVYDTSDPEAKQAAAVRAAQFAQGLATFAKAAGPKLAELPVDWVEAAERCGIPMTSGEDAYSQDDEEELSAEEWVDPPQHMKAAARRSLSWVHALKRGGGEVGRSMARKLVRGRLSRADILQIAKYWPHHEHDQRSPNWNNLARPSNSRIAWGLWGDSGDGKGRKWSVETAAEIRGRLTESEAATINKRLALPGEQLALPAPAALEPVARIGKVGRSQRTKDLVGIVSVAVFDPQGRLLLGRRADTGKVTTPGGHLEPGEAPVDGAKRELWEEAGISAPLIYLGSGSTPNGYLVHCFRADGVTTAPTSQGDPDAEVSEWRWVQLPPAAPWTPESLPLDVRSNLHAPKNVLLALLGLGPDAGLALVRTAGQARVA